MRHATCCWNRLNAGLDQFSVSIVSQTNIQVLCWWNWLLAQYEPHPCDQLLLLLYLQQKAAVPKLVEFAQALLPALCWFVPIYILIAQNHHLAAATRIKAWNSGFADSAKMSSLLKWNIIFLNESGGGSCWLLLVLLKCIYIISCSSDTNFSLEIFLRVSCSSVTNFSWPLQLWISCSSSELQTCSSWPDTIFSLEFFSHHALTSVANVSCAPQDVLILC